MKHALLLLLAIGCASDDDTFDGELLSAETDGGLYAIGYRTEPSPPVSGSTALFVVVEDLAQDRAPVTGATLGVEPWMPAMGHGISGEVAIAELGDGEYRATWAYSMPGAWEVTVEVDADAGVDAVTLEFDVE